MKYSILFVLALLIAASPVNASESAPLTTAILDFQTSGERLEKIGTEAALLLNAQLSASPQVILVERQELTKILGEQELGLSGAVTPGSAAQIGQLTGAKVLITGRLFESGEKLYLVAKLMSTDNGRVYGESVSVPSVKSLDQGVEALKTKLETLLEKRGDTLVSEVETPEARIARWKKAVEGKPLPKIAIAITEEHLSRRVIDPAVETEFKLTLRQLGFEIVPEAEGELIITGEAFSEGGMRRGNLVACRARVEIALKRREGGQLIAADRQTSAGIDLAEHTAAKKALENAAVALLERTLPRLTPAP
jgi:hypothetical protein